MTLDQYQLCPCGSGKKIKFCCSREFIHDLDRIQRMIQGDQRLAALEKTEALLAKYPDRPALLMTKVDILIQLEEVNKAREVVERMSEVDPQNPTALAVRSLMAILVDGNLTAAIHLLQDAFERVDGVVTARMYEAIVTIGKLLLRVGMPVASKGHLQLALALTDSKDDSTVQLLMQLNHSRQIPLLLREPMQLRDGPANVTWRIEFQTAMRQIFRGCWRAGAAYLAAMSARILDAPAILFNLGVVQAWLGNNPAAVQAFRQFARIRDVPLDDRVQAFAIAEDLDLLDKRNVVDVIARTYELTELDRTLERCLSDKRLKELRIDREGSDEGDKPLPRAAVEVLDKPLPAERENLQLDDIPEAWGTVMLYGKETDRPARLEVQCPRTGIDRLEQVCRELAGGELGAATDERVIGKLSWFGCEVLATWRLPERLPIDERQRLGAALRRRAVLERWPITPCPALDGKTPREAAGDSAYKVAVLAQLLNLELLAQDADWDLDFNQLRRDLQLPERQPIDAATVDLQRLPIHRFSLLKVEDLNDEQLLAAYRRAYSVMAVCPLRRICSEVISRESLSDQIDKVEAYDILSDVAVNTDEALDYLAKARRLATSEGESPAAWLIDELEIRLLRGEVDKFVGLIKEVQSRYIKEPGIVNSLMDVLARYGLVTPDGRIVVPTVSDAAAAETADTAPRTSTLWTPDSDIAPVASAGQTTKPESKIWTPDMD